MDKSINERGAPKEKAKLQRVDHTPPSRLDSLNFPTNRLPQLAVEIVSKLPDVGKAPGPRRQDSTDNYNTDPSLPLPITLEKTLFNLWEKTQTQTEVKWRKPDNAGDFHSVLYEIQLLDKDGAWQVLTDIRQPLYRVYFVDGKAIFGRTKVCQEDLTFVVHMRVRPVGVKITQGREERLLGPWTEDILFSIEGSSFKR